MKTIVLGDGLLGKEIVKQTGWDFISRKKDGINLTEIESWSELLLSYDTVINCIAHTKTYDFDKKTHWDVNYKAVSFLVDYCNNHKKKLVHISTDYVYTNSVSDATENDVPIHGNNWYSFTKLLADSYIELKSKNYLICRLSHKPYPFPYEKAWNDQLTNGDYVNVIASIVIKLILSEQVGMINVGTAKKTWYELTKQEFNTLPISAPEEAPFNVSMNISKLKTFLG